MRIGMTVSYSGGFAETVAELEDFEKVGLDIVAVPEVYTFDAVSQLGFIAARTSRLEITSGILQLYTRTPTLTAMTAAGLDFVSGGRFWLGLGASGPQVIEGFHGVVYDAPLARTREVVEICRQVWRREPVVHQGRYYQIPLPEGQGSGLGKPLKIINRPVRPRIPIILAAIGPRNVALAAEIAEGWLPLFFHPDKVADAWESALQEGYAKRDPQLGPLDITASVPLAIGEGIEDNTALLQPYRAQLALYIGGMGAKGKNFYNDLARRYGYEQAAEVIQDLYLAGHKEQAAAAVPDDLVRDTSLVGPPGYIKERVAAFAAAGVTTLHVTPLAATHAERVHAVEQLRAIID
ncbi:LLM class F420-dependent oxidoreductase [Candidatus Protofrankia californiensis]|uniref:LLM class F420-dependent oxidoreductase n=1 Tax=Candidatus Protofrankia californiensis TaxID=1839754 RepID=UPI001041BA73|nr:LLM class F420-dependent oxidoreductase [Candidatus Protofrankia californiensis]